MRHASRFGLLALLSALVLPAACNNAGDDVTFGPFPTGQIGVLVFLDRDGSGGPTSSDTSVTGVRVALLGLSGSDTVRALLTDPNGFALFDSVPLGDYRVAVDSARLGDSLRIAAVDSAQVQVLAGGGAIGVLVRLAFPEVSLKAVRSLPLGAPVFVRGVVLAGVQSFRDTTSHLADSSGALRLTEVALAGGLVGNNPGDSVVAQGRVGSRAGQPVLAMSRLTRIASRPAPISLPVSTLFASTAGADGALDAALVQVTGAVISDTVSSAPDFRITVSDGTGDLVVTIDGNLTFVRTVFAPGRILDARGVLVPDGPGKWSLKPRAGGDLVLR